MTLAVENIISQIETLTPEERGELAYAFLCSFEPSEEVAAAWEVEVARRWAEVKDKKVQGLPANELFAEIRQPSRS